MAHVFISYAHADGDFAAALIRQIEKVGFKSWIDSEQLRAGEDWRQAIDDAIWNSFALIVIMSPEAKASEFVTYEWACAWGAKVKVIPVLFKSTELHPRLATLQYLDFIDYTRRPWEKLILRLHELENQYKFQNEISAQNAEIGRLIAELDSWSSDKRLNAISELENAALRNNALALNVLIENALKRSPYKDVREASARAIGSIGDSTAVPELIRSLRDDDGDVRRASRAALKAIGTEAVDGLIGALRTGHDSVRTAAAELLGIIKDSAAIPELIAALRYTDYQVRFAAAWALGEIGDSKAVVALVETLQDNHTDVKNAAAQALEQIGTPEALAAVEQWRRGQDGQA